LPLEPLQGARQLKKSMKSASKTVNGLPVGVHGPANVAAFKEG
jgi:hypothetical protein